MRQRKFIFFIPLLIALPVLLFFGSQQPPYREARLLMGTLNEIQVFDLPKAQAKEAVSRAFDAMNKVDQLMSHYKETSEISQIKHLKSLESMPVSEETFTVLKRSQDFSKMTEGAFDITIGTLIKRWGFYHREERDLPTKKELKQILTQTGSNQFDLVLSTKSITVHSPHLDLDLGGIAKGYAIDCALQELRHAGVQKAIVNSGGNIGFLGSRPQKEGWRVGVKNPKDPKALLGWLEVPEGAVATSGNYENFFDIKGTRYAHIVDPRTGWPVQGVLSVTVAAPNAMDADALSTALFVLGPEKGIRLAEELKAKALFVLEGEAEGVKLLFSPGFETQFSTK